MKKFETLKAGLGNGLIVSLTEQGHAECDFYSEDYDLLKPYKLVNIDFEDNAIYTITSLSRKMAFDDLDGEFIASHLFPLDHLTKPMRVEGYNDGKEFVPIVELAKHMNFTPQKHLLSIIDDTAILQGEYYVHPEKEESSAHSFFEVDLEDCNMDYGIHYHNNHSDEFYPVRNQLDLFQLLHKWHFNVFNLDPSDYIDASQSKVYEPK